MTNQLITTNNNIIDISHTTRSDKEDIISHFTKDQILYILHNIPPDKSMMFQFLWRTGIRVSELINIKKNNIDFENDEITIRWLKNRKAIFRVIPLHHSFKNSLWMYCAKLKYDDKLFSITRQRVDQLCKKYHLGHCHKIRHSFAINFLRQSDSPMALLELKNLLGHSKIETTMVYLQVVPMQLKASMKQISFD